MQLVEDSSVKISHIGRDEFKGVYDLTKKGRDSRVLTYACCLFYWI